MASIQGVYVALFGRPADPSGLAFFNTATNSGADLTQIGDLASTAEYKARFEGQSNAQIITSIYQSLFGRDPEAAGLEFFASALQNGTFNINNIAIAILDGATGTDKTLVEKKIAAADLFTAAIDTGTEAASYTGTAAAAKGIAFLTAVTATSSTVDAAAAQAAVTDLANPTTTTTTGVTIALSDGATDIASDTAANPATKTTAGNDTINGAIEVADTINGAGGTDVFNGTLADEGNANTANTTTIAKDKFSNTENVFVKALDISGGNVLDVKEATGILQLWNDDSDNALTFSNVDNTATTVGLKGTIAGTTTVTGKTDTAADTLKIASDSGNLGANTLTTDKFEALEISTTGGLVAQDVQADDAKSVKISGTGAIDFASNGASDLSMLTSLDMTGAKGNATIHLTNSGSTAGVKLTLAEGVNTVTLASGKDTLVYNTANKSVSSSIDTINGFDATSEDKVDLSAFALTGDKTSVQTFNATPTEGVVFTSAVALDTANNVLYADTNNNGVVDLATDLAVNLAGVAAMDAADFIFA